MQDNVDTVVNEVVQSLWYIVLLQN